jgi:hypothetical protein
MAPGVLERFVARPVAAASAHPALVGGLAVARRRQRFQEHGHGRGAAGADGDTQPSPECIADESGCQDGKHAFTMRARAAERHHPLVRAKPLGTIVA